MLQSLQQYIHRSVTLVIPAFVFLMTGATQAQDNNCDTTVESGDLIQDAIDEASAGETICVEDGVYQEELIMDVDGLALVSAGETKPVLEGIAEETTGITIQSSEITIRGFRFESHVNAILLEREQENISDLNIENNSFIHVEYGIMLWEPEDVVIHNNSFHPPSENVFPRSAIQLRRQIAGVTISENHINEWRNGISADGGAFFDEPEWDTGHDIELHITGNVIRNSPFRGIPPQPVAIEKAHALKGDVIIENNEFYENESGTGLPADVYIEEVHNVIIRENIHRGSECGPYWVRDSEHIEIRNNDIDIGGNSPVSAIRLDGHSSNGIVADNIIRGITRSSSASGYGVLIRSANNNQIIGNEIREVSYGFRIEADSVYVEDNIIEETRRITNDGRVFPLPGFRIDDSSANKIENTTISGVLVEGEFHRWEVQEHSMVFEDVEKLSGIDEPIDRPEDFASAGIYLYFDYFNTDDSRADIMISYADTNTNNIDVQEENLRAMIYNYEFDQWEVIPYPNGVNTDEEHVYARVTKPGTVGLFELGDVALAYGDFQVDDHILAGYDTFPLNVMGIVSNVGIQSGPYEIEVLVDDEVVETIQSTVDGELTDTVSISHIMQGAGMFEVTVRTDDVVILVEEIEVVSPTAGDEGSQPDEQPSEFVLEQNYPNPFNPATNIRFGLPEASQVQVAVYDLLGRKVATLVDGFREFGYHDVVFDAGHLSSGMYIYRIRAGEYEDAETMLLVK